MQKRSLVYRNSTVNYYRFGRGPSIVLCFHGYGEEAAQFSFLEKYVGDRYSFYAIDLPFHGATNWKEGLNFTNEDLTKIAAQVLLENNPVTENLKYNLVGFSLGGRVALSLYQAEPARVQKLILLAPDGLKVNFWYWLATQSSLGNRLFALSMKRPGWFFALLKFLNKLGFVNSSVYKFVNYYIGNPEARDLLYKRWTGLRGLKPNLSGIQAYIRQYSTPTRLLYGKYDRIILPARGEKFQKGIEELCTINVVDAGHQVLHENHVKSIIQALQE